MSRSAHQRQQQKLQMQQQQLLAQQMADNEAAAAAAEMFDLFCLATTMRQILGLHRQMCDVVGLRPAPLNEFYPKLKTKVRSWKAQALWKKFDARASHRAYAKGNACTGTRVLVIGAGPCGLRTAIEAQLLGAKVVVVEKRDRISRNNVLHLWPFVITDLRNLGAKKFYGKFCAGSIDHISIRQIQCILLKVALLLGVEIHEGVSFESTIEPSGDGSGWKASITPADHAVSHYEFDVLIGADGKRNTLEAFKRKEFRGKLAIAITANFINKKTEAEAKAEEISGVAFIFNQSFFKELYHTTGIDLENIVYYKDETHYFVMTAKKHSLIDKGVIIQDFADPAELLASVNVNTEKLLDYAREAAEFSTKYQMPNLEFAVNHYGKPDVAMFDFTSMFAAESSCRVIVRKGFRLLQCLVGDSLLEPFWPTGSGCARGFLSSMDAAYAIKLWSNPANSTLGVMAQRESIYRLLGQTTPENLQRDIGGYTVDPATRYPNLNRTSVNVWQVKHLIDTDDKAVLEQTFMDTNVTQVDTPVRRKRRSGDTIPLSTVLLRWICAQLHAYEFTKDLKEVSDIFANGKVLCALINRYRPDLVDFNAVKDLSPVEQNDLAFKILDKELHIPRVMTAKDSIQLSNVDSKVWLNYLEQICEVFRGEIPHVKHPKIDFSDLRQKYKVNYAHAQPDFSKLLQLSTKQKSKSPIQDAVDVPQVVPQRRSVLDEEKLKRQRRHEQQLAGNATGAGNAAQTDTPRRAKKRRSADKAANIEERQKRLQDIENNRQDRQSKRRQQRYQQTQNFYKSLHMLQANNLLREADENTPFEDYSIFLYRQQAPEFNDRVKELERKLLYPDRDRSDIPSALPRNVDEQFSDRIKNMEQRITSRNAYGTDKKPKDLMRAIGKIDSTDWNVREIEKKIEQSKKTEVHGPKGREKVPKWSREQFQARQHKMSKPMRQDSSEDKFKEIDQTIKNLDKQLKEGNVLEVGKVASIAGQFVKRDDTSEEKNPPTVVPKSSSKVALAFKKQAASEKCHFCKQTVYLMEKLQCENLVMHRGCLKCHHCHTNLRLGAYAFDRDDPNGRFYCTQHFRLPAKAIRPVVRKPGQRKSTQQQQQDAAAAVASTAKTPISSYVVNSESGDEPRTPDKRGPVDNVAKLDLLERGQTPERIEFENTDAMSDGEPSEEHIIDEHEWSGRNFLPESNNDSESDLSSSDESDTESDSEMFEEANDSPLGAQTLQLASDWIGKQNYTDSDDSDDFYDSSEGMADDGKDDTEGEEFEKARELRREEVRLPPLPANLPTDTETEVVSTSENNQTPLNNKDINENKESQILETEVKSPEVSKTKEPEIKEDPNQGKEMEAKSAELSETKEPEIKEDPNKRKDSLLSNNSELSFKSTSSLTNGNQILPRTSKTDIEKLEQNSDHKFSADIDAISEKLYRLNNVVKMNKDLETIAKENLIRSDILKKLSMKEKWLADNKAGAATNATTAKSKFEEKVDNFLKPISKFVEELKPKSIFNDQKKDNDDKMLKANEAKLNNDLQPKSKFNDDLQPKSKFNDQQPKSTVNDNLQPKSKFNDLQPKSKFNDNLQPKSKFNDLQPKSKFNDDLQPKSKFNDDLQPKSKFNDQLHSKTELPQNGNVLDLLKDLKNKENLPQTKTSSQSEAASVSSNKPASRTNSFKNPQTSSSPLLKAKTTAEVSSQQELAASKKPSSRSNSFKSPASSSPLLKAKTDTKIPIVADNKMEIENILNIVKNIDISKSDSKDSINKTKDMGQMFYKVESKFSPKPNKKLLDKLKEIEAKSFSGTLDSIKSQMETPTVHTQAVPTNVDLTKYFPEPKQEKNTSNLVNKNQKTLNQVDLTKYFPSSPVPQRRSSVVTVADKLRKSQTEKSLDNLATTSKPKSPSNERTTVTKNPPKRQASLGSAATASDYSLKDNQLDGAIDIAKKKPLTKVVTTTAVANTGKKGNVKIIKKIIKKVTKTNNSSNTKVSKPGNAKKSLLAKDEDDRILDEILESSNEAQRSPSLEYKQLFQEEKSPSEDISDKIEQILEETGIDLGIPKKSSHPAADINDKRKTLLKAKSFGEGELLRKSSLINKDNEDNLSETKEEGDRPSGVQNLLKRFESMSSVPSTASDHAFKLRRMESTTSNLNKSKESIVSRESESFSDLEKTMEYLKSEWRSEATNFLQKKRNDYNNKKQTKEEEEKVEKSVKPLFNDLPIQYKESKFAKFFGLKPKSPEKRKKSPIKKKKTPEKKKSPEKKLQPIARPSKPIIYTSLEELALISMNKISPVRVVKETEIVPKEEELEKATIKPEILTTTKDEEVKTKEQDSEIKIQAKETEIKTIDSENTLDNKRPAVEDIKNLPKFGSLSSSRRGSQTSLQSRRSSLTEKLEVAVADFEKLVNSEGLVTNDSQSSPQSRRQSLQSENLDLNYDNIEDFMTNDNLKNSRKESQSSTQSHRLPQNSQSQKLELNYDNIEDFMKTDNITNSRRDSKSSTQSRKLSQSSQTESMENVMRNDNSLKPIMNADNYDTDSLCTSISKSPSVQPITVQLRGSSEDESIEKLFSQFSDEMLVNVEFDSNDELIAITPRSPLNKEQQNELNKDMDIDIIDRVQSLERDEQDIYDEIDIPENLDRVFEEISENVNNNKDNLQITQGRLQNSSHLKIPLKSFPNDFNFPTRPQRRQKSHSSSSDSNTPLAPQRIKKKLLKLSPSNMPPSVQDLLHTVCENNLNKDHPEDEQLQQPLSNTKPLKFPRIIDEDDVLLDESQAFYKYFIQDKAAANENSIRYFKEEETEPKSSNPSLIVTNSLNDGFQINKAPENVMEFTKVLRPLSPSKESLKEADSENVSISSTTKDRTSLAVEQIEPQKFKSREPSLEWNMEMMPNSPMPPRRKITIPTNAPKVASKLGSIESLNKLKKMQMTSSKEKLQTEDSATQKESQPETSSNEKQITKDQTLVNLKQKSNQNALETAEKLSINSQTASVGSENTLSIREKSPTTSIKLLNNIDLNTEASQKRLIQEFELERRQALIQRDKQYQVMEKPKLPQSSSSSKDSSKNSSKKSTPLPTPSKQSPRDSRRSSIQSSATNRAGTPPMTKPLEISATTSTQTSRRSSFAFIEMLDSKPIIAPMPKKLDLPKIEDVPEKPDNLSNIVITEDMKIRPWPKLPEDEDDNDEEKDETDSSKFTENVEYANISMVTGPKRDWPDGKTVFSNKSNKKQYPRYKPRSETPETNHSNTDEFLEKAKPSSKSITDLRKLQSPYNSNYSLANSAITQSSNDTNPSKQDHFHSSTTPQRPTRYKPNNTTAGNDDASTQMLLERSKRLHNRKRDFVNERVVERNPYMKDVINEERRNSGYVKDDTDDDDEISTYRPRRYSGTTTTNTSRFPSSRALGRPNLSHNYDYVPSYNDSSLSYSTRRLPTVSSLPTTHHHHHNLSYLGGSSSNYHYKPYTSTGRSSYLTSDYSRRSPSLLRDRTDLSKENCVQTESESTSPDEIELNSATEISTDSEFDHDERIRETPKIFIDDTHLRKPTKVQIKSTVIPPSMGQKYNNASINNAQQQATKGGGGTSYLTKYQTQPQQPLMPQFKPLVQVDPSLLTSNRTPLQNPRPGDYLLNKTASTEGIASKKSLELKKRYLLGEQANGNKIQKSGSTSVLDSRIRSFQSNISECQKLLNPSNDINSSMKTILDRTKENELMRSATNNILNDLKVEITIQKASSTASTDNEKENLFVNSKNELNKCMEYSETVNNTLMDVMNKKSPTTPTNNKNILLETIDLVTPEKENTLDTSDSNKVIDLTGDSPLRTIIESAVIKPDLSLDVKQCIPDILGHIEKTEESVKSKECTPTQEKKDDDEEKEDEVNLIDNNMEKADAPEKLEAIYDNDEVEDLQIEVPHIAWNTKPTDNLSSSSNSTCSSHSSSLEDIEHYILESTTSPETHNSGILGSSSGNHQVPRLEIHDTSGTLMQIDSLMIIDGRYIGDPEDLKFIDVPEGIIVPETPAIKTSVVEEEHEIDVEPVTATPEPAETTVIEKDKELRKEVEFYKEEEEDEEEEEVSPPPLPEKGPPLPEKGPPKIKPSNLKFDTKNENKIESLKNLPLIVDTTSMEQTKAVKPISLNLTSAHKTPETPTTPKANLLQTPTSPLVDMDKTPTGDLLSRGSDSETEPTGTAQILTETELSDWTADDCISENFVDMEFVHHSTNKTNLKGGNKKLNRKEPSHSNTTRYLPTTNEVLREVAKSAPVAEFEGILKSIDIDDIEFMDTGSDGSGTEPLSATNTAMLRNRGYMEFVENSAKTTKTNNKVEAQKAFTGAKEIILSYKPIQTKRDEKLGIDYIEQGSYIMHDDVNKTPVNEAQPIPPNASTLMTQSLTDSSTINDIEDESTCNLSSQIQLTSLTTISKNTTQQNTTTEESEALTVVTSPFDSSSPPQTQNTGIIKREVAIATGEKTSSSTLSSSDRAPRTSQSTSCTNSGTSSTKNTPPRQLSKDPLMAGENVSSLRKSNDELSYEEYVRALQHKIVQISTTARGGDSLETRKQRRKSSKGEAPLVALTNPQQTVIESTNTPSDLRLNNDKEEMMTKQLQAVTTSTNQTTASVVPTTPTQLNKVPEIPTLTSKLEEITKERTKQKDLIHDLVMDKLQSKKQLNAEKRLHRSRQRTLLTSSGGGGCLGSGGGYSSGSSLSPTPKLAAANSTTDTNCTNQAHYHVSTAAVESSTSPSARSTTAQRLINNTHSSFKENKPSSTATSTYVSAYGMEALSPTRANVYKQRPFSEILEGDCLKSFEHRYKINKTPSFSITSSTKTTKQRIEPPTDLDYTTPVPPQRQKRAGDSIATTPTETNKDSNFSVSTENLRSEARARARLKSNSELGLSPEEKMQLLRKRLQAEYNTNLKQESEVIAKPLYDRQLSNSIREQKMSNSKSVNDLAYLTQSQQQNANLDAIASSKASCDFTSDPNILLSSTQPATANANKLLKTKSGRRPKDPERRKSLIQSLSNFFHKAPQNKENKQQKDATATTSDGSSAQPERPGTGGGSSSTSTSQTVSGGIDGVLSRFRISPKSKEKSRDKEDYLYNMAHSSCSPTRRLRTSSASMAMTKSYECHNSNDYLGKTHLAHTPYSHSQINNMNYNIQNNSNNSKYRHHQQQQHTNNKQQHLPHSQNKKSSSSSALAFSSSSPQLCVNKSQSMTNTNAAAYDDQTPPPIPPLPLNYQRSDDESYATETRDQKKQRAISKAVRQAELKRLRIAQEIQREQEEIEVQLKELETRGVLIEKALRGEEQNYDNPDSTNNIGSSDEKLLKELLEIWRNITQLKKRDEELGIRQQELQLEHRHAQLKEELNLRLSCNKLDKSSADVAAEGAILNEMLEIVAKRAALRPSASNHDLAGASELLMVGEIAAASTSSKLQLKSRGQSNDNEESNI